uniref:Pyridoxal phosphate homeostasis protein n=1 Tax=Steinernema glaseri TaxID=37863 RepID=A0A1I7YMU5_9BILA
MASNLKDNLNAILQSIDDASAQFARNEKPLLLAVSKTKPASMIKDLYDAGHRHFGENYVQELEQKAAELAEPCPDIRWHYIGTVQTNKIPKLVAIENLYCVEGLSSMKHCSTFQNEVAKRGRSLRVLVQMNSSEEEQKGGGNSAECIEMANYVSSECPNLQFTGFMTIGSFDRDPNEFNPDFDALYQLRDKWCEQAGKPVADYSLSMGMSNDFVQAIKQGSTEVRVGSSLFGARVYT